MTGDGPNFEELLKSPLEEREAQPVRGLVIGLAVAVVLAVAGVWIGMTLAGSGEDSALGTASPDATASGSGDTVSGGPGAAPETTTTTEPPPVLESPVRVEGSVPGPEPGFDTGDLGFRQEFVPIESLSLQERRIIGGTDQIPHLTARIRVAVGEAPGSSIRVLLAEGIDTFPDGSGAGAGSADQRRCVWIPGIPLPDDVATDCHEPPEGIVALWSGVEDEEGILAWAGLPAEASVAVLTIDGEGVAWERPRSGVVVFDHEQVDPARAGLRVLDVAGSEIATADRTPLTPLPDGPVTGYGDYSGLTGDDVPWAEVWPLVGECMTDLGFDTVGGDRWLIYLEVPGTYEPIAAAQNACLEGMGLGPVALFGR